MRIRMLAFAMLSGISHPALAADPMLPMEEQPPPVFNWTGGYIGAQVGYSWGSGSLALVSANENPNPAKSYPDPNGWLAGGYFGYNYQFTNNIVLGAEADIAWSSADDMDRLSADVQGNFAHFFAQDVNWTAAVRARLGYAVNRWLPFISAGVAFADLDQVLLRLDSPSRFHAGGSYTGWTIGAGAEYAFTENILVRGEYRFTDFDADGTINVPSTFGFETSFETHDIRFGIAYKF